MTLKETIIDALNSNDVECLDKLLAIRKKAKAQELADELNEAHHANDTRSACPSAR